MGERTDIAVLIERLEASAAAFRKHPVHTADGDRVFLTVQAAEMEEAAALLAFFSPADGWRPIETAPKDGTPILAGYWGHDVALVVNWQSDPDVNGWVTGETNNDGSYATFDVDCWQPLPAAPPPPGDQG